MLPAVIWPTHCSSSHKSLKVVMFLATTKGTTSNPSSKPTNGPPATLFDAHSCTRTGPLHTKWHEHCTGSNWTALFFTCCELLAKRRSGKGPRPSHRAMCSLFFLQRTHVTHNAAARKRSDVCLGCPARLETPTRLTQFQYPHPPPPSCTRAACWTVSREIATDLLLFSPVLLDQRPTTIFPTMSAC